MMSSAEARLIDAELERLSDDELVDRGAGGEAIAFAALMRRYNRKLYRAARAMTGDSAEAEDVVQETWVRAYAHLRNFRKESAFPTWLLRILINEALSRKRRARSTIGLDETNEQQMSSVIMFPSSANDPESSMSRTQVRHLLERAIDALPLDFRLVFVLRVVEDMSGAEVAEQLGIPEATVKTRLHRARALIQRELAKSFAGAFADVFPFAGARCEALSRRVLRRVGLLPDNPYAVRPD
jgi:RNA polymerase sigma-70 factor, ECF subfamily